LRLIYSIAIFVNAALLFWIQPVAAKMILPYVGGVPAVWNTCLFFFQGFLLAGYLYAHFGSLWLGPRLSVILHLGVALCGIFFLPIAFSWDRFAAPNQNPALLVLSALTASVAFPFFVLAAGSPLFQRWFAATGHPDAADPYFLYAASNLGSIAGLLAYPTLFEPYFTLGEQSRIWFWGYAALLVLIFTSAVASRLMPKVRDAQDIELASAASEIKEEIGFARRARWVALSFAPSSLLLGVTTYITTDLASVPLFWVLPLTLYLLSFVAAFARSNLASRPFVVRRQGFLVAAAAITFFIQTTQFIWLIVPLHLLAFFATALVCHGELAKDRPRVEHLTEFYVWISIGGLLGGFFNSLLAPMIFKRVEEYPLAMIAAVLLRPYLEQSRERARANLRDFVLPCCLGLVVLALTLGSRESALLRPRFTNPFMWGLAGVACLSFARRPVRFGLGLAAVLLATYASTGPYKSALYRERSFFGVYRVLIDRDETHHFLLNGTTLHGTQNLDPKTRLIPTSYYYPTGPIGQVFEVYSRSHANGRVAIVGLGAGGLSCHGISGQSFTFYEIDPLVEQVARDTRLFTFLRDCPPRTKVEIGDARLSLLKAPDHYYDLFVLDAFSSDAIPTHLLTQEALKLYLAKLAPDGVLVFHVSNRFFNLAPVLGRAALSLGLIGLIRDDFRFTDAQIARGATPSRWAIMARDKAALREFTNDPRWKALEARAGVNLWTDSYSNVLKVFLWN
jgi:hypothetical protein